VIYKLGSTLLGYFTPSGLSNSDNTTDPKVACSKFFNKF